MAKKDIGTGFKGILFRMVRTSNGITSADLIEKLSVSKPTVLKWLAELESEGLIQREKQPGIRARLWTATGEKVKSKLLPSVVTRFVGDKNPWNT